MIDFDALSQAVFPGDIVQITDESHDWHGCLVVVSKTKSFGVQGYVSVPMSGDAYIRLEASAYEKVGKAALVRGSEFEEETS